MKLKNMSNLGDITIPANQKNLKKMCHLGDITIPEDQNEIKENVLFRRHHHSHRAE